MGTWLGSQGEVHLSVTRLRGIHRYRGLTVDRAAPLFNRKGHRHAAHDSNHADGHADDKTDGCRIESLSGAKGRVPAAEKIAKITPTRVSVTSKWSVRNRAKNGKISALPTMSINDAPTSSQNCQPPPNGRRRSSNGRNQPRGRRMPCRLENCGCCCRNSATRRRSRRPRT